MFLKSGLMLEGDSGEEVALWLLTSLCTSTKREVEVALWFYQVALLILTVKKHRYIFTSVLFHFIYLGFVIDGCYPKGLVNFVDMISFLININQWLKRSNVNNIHSLKFD